MENTPLLAPESTEPLPTVETQFLPEENSVNYSVVDVEKKNLFKNFTLYCPLVIGVSMFVSLNTMISIVKTDDIDTEFNFSIDFLALLETINAILLITVLVFLFKFIFDRKKYVTSYSFTEIEKLKLKISFGFMISMYILRISFQCTIIALVPGTFIYNICEGYYNNEDAYYCANSRYIIFISSISLISDIIGLIISIIAICSIVKFSSTPINLKKKSNYTNEMDNNKQNYFICFILPTIFMCLGTYFSILLISFATVIIHRNINSYYSTVLLEVLNLSCIFVTNICLYRYIIQRKKIITNFTEKERQQYIISYSFQFVLALCMFSLVVWTECLSVFDEAIDIVLLSLTAVVSGLHLIISPAGIYISKKSYVKKYMNNSTEKVENEVDFVRSSDYINTEFTNNSEQTPKAI